MTQVTIRTPAPRGGRKIRGLNNTGTKKMWVEKRAVFNLFAIWRIYIENATPLVQKKKCSDVCEANWQLNRRCFFGPIKLLLCFVLCK